MRETRRDWSIYGRRGDRDSVPASDRAVHKYRRRRHACRLGAKRREIDRCAVRRMDSSGRRPVIRAPDALCRQTNAQEVARAMRLRRRCETAHDRGWHGTEGQAGLYHTYCMSMLSSEGWKRTYQHLCLCSRRRFIRGLRDSGIAQHIEESERGRTSEQLAARQ